jgi:Protein of unknown function (DUF3990)
MPILNPAPAWTKPHSRYVILWHGCTTADKNAIELNGVDPSQGQPNTDFGRGFYTTTIERQAKHWAWARFYDPRFTRTTGVQPVVLRFRVDRHKLAKLRSLSFGSGDYGNEDFWSLIQHCRQSTPTTDPPPHIVNDHAGPVREGGCRWYDIVSGPVAAFWEQRSAMQDADQVSFHTKKAAKLLTDLIGAGDPTDYQWNPVT